MFLAIAALLIQTHAVPQLAFPAEKAALELPISAEAAANSANPENSSEVPAESECAAPVDESAALPEPSALPEAPTPAPAINVSAPAAFLKPANPMKVSVNALREENRKKERLWLALGIAAHSGAAYDAWSTRNAITQYGVHELNPLLKPFAGNASLYVVIQVAPALMDFAARKMMYSRHPLLRHTWWIPQSASLAGSLFCGTHNVLIH
jgi:hypothetical protein